MKGFIRILEAIIASIILLTTLSFFFTVPLETDWDVALLQTNVQDALIVLDRGPPPNLQTYIINNDKTAIRNALDALLPNTVDFSVNLEGIPNPEIFISCDCDDVDLRTILQVDGNDKIQFKNREITIRFKREPMTSIDSRSDIFFIFGYPGDLSLLERNSVDAFLENGGTLFMLADLPVTLDTDIEEIFGLQATGSGGPPNANFYDTASASTISFRIFDYFINVEGRQPGQDFGTFVSHEIAVDDNSIIVDTGTNTNSYAKVNPNVTSSGRGRAIWIANYDYNALAAAELNTSKLVTALILWGSGEDYNLDPTPKVVPDVFSEYRYLGVIDGINGVEPFSINLRVWRIFF